MLPATRTLGLYLDVAWRFVRNANSQVLGDSWEPGSTKGFCRPWWVRRSTVPTDPENGHFSGRGAGASLWAWLCRPAAGVVPARFRCCWAQEAMPREGGDGGDLSCGSSKTRTVVDWTMQGCVWVCRDSPWGLNAEKADPGWWERILCCVLTSTGWALGVPPHPPDRPAPREAEAVPGVSWGSQPERPCARWSPATYQVLLHPREVDLVKFRQENFYSENNFLKLEYRVAKKLADS